MSRDAIDSHHGVTIRRVAAALLLLLATATIGTGAYLLVVRPVMLPEDVRFTGVKPELLPPAMREWLALVIRTWGGFVVGFGISLAGVAGYLLTSRRAVLSWSVAVGILVAFGRFLASNVRLHSDFLWFVGGLLALAAVTTALLVVPEAHRADRED
jgi:hypothetical protein